MGLKLTGFGLLFAAFILIAGVLYYNSGKADSPLVYAPTQILNATWIPYKDYYLEKNSGRTIDPSRDDMTTSEGESYTMLRAVWLGDKATFDRSWNFTRDNMQRKDDQLFSWLYGKRADGSFGILTDQGGVTSASDADSDIALSLIFAYSRWQDPAYLSAAKGIVNGIWNSEVIYINGTPYLTADNLEKTSNAPTALINPSYLSPHAYRVFAKIDPAHPWLGLVDSSYSLLQKTITAPLGSPQGALPPDWVAINKQTGALSATHQTTLSTNYGYDAMRVPWRIALDWQWNKDPRAKEVLSHMTALSDAWNKGNVIDATYSHEGTAVESYESPAMYGGAIGYFIVTNPSVAKEVYTKKLVYLYEPDTNDWKQRLSYYDDNWAWFGIALYNNLLPNLSEHLPASAGTTSI